MGKEREENNSVKKRKFVIIGGGIAGLAAANKLIKSGERDIAILEAKDRLGGRIHTIKQDDGPLELGAQWIHGEEGNALYDLAKCNGFLYDFRDDAARKEFWLDFESSGNESSDDADSHFCTSDGNRVSMKLVQRIISKFNDALWEAETYFREEKFLKRENFQNLLLREVQNHTMVCLDNFIQLGKKNDTESSEGLKPATNENIISHSVDDMSVASFVEQKLKECLGSAEDKEIEELMFGLLDWRLCVEKTENSCSSLNEIPLSNWGEYYLCPGDEGVELGVLGYQAIIDYFVKDIMPHCIKLNSVVKKIVWYSANEADGFADENSEPVERSGHDSCDASLAQRFQQLRSSGRRARLRSSLNLDKSSKIEVLLESGDIYLADYVLVTLPLGVLKHSCLHNKTEQELFVPRLPTRKLEAIEKLAYGTVDKIYLEFDAPFWDSDSELGFQIIWKRGEVLELDCLKKWGRCYEDTKWLRAIQGFNGLLQHRNLLCGWIAGSDAVEMEKEDDAFVTEVCREILARFSGKGDKVPMPKRIIKTSWNSDPFSRGSYSYRAFGSSVESSLDLAQPLPSEENPRLLFAGEATHSIFYSTVHGAMLTGFNQACTMLKHSQGHN